MGTKSPPYMSVCSRWPCGPKGVDCGRTYADCIYLVIYDWIIIMPSKKTKTTQTNTTQMSGRKKTLCSLPDSTTLNSTQVGAIIADETPLNSSLESIEHTCPICEVGVTYSQDTLFCEGKCQVWYHRLCASVSRARYVALSNSSEQFLCPLCTLTRLSEDIASIHSEVTSLTFEIQQLREALQTTSSSVQRLENLTSTTTYANVTRTINPRFDGQPQQTSQRSGNSSHGWQTVSLRQRKGRQNSDRGQWRI